MMTDRGRFITFEGIDGSGKSTQVAFLYAVLLDAGINCFITREPRGSIRDSLLGHDWNGLEETFLLIAGRSEHVRTTIKPALNAGKWVVCDRFVDTTVAYQGHGRDVNLRLLAELNNLAVDGCWPDLTVLLDVPVTVARERLTGRAKFDRIEVLGDEFFNRTRHGFLDIARNRGNGRVFVVNATAEADVVHGYVLEEIKRRFEVDLRKSDNG